MALLALARLSPNTWTIYHVTSSSGEIDIFLNEIQKCSIQSCSAHVEREKQMIWLRDFAIITDFYQKEKLRELLRCSWI